ARVLRPRRALGPRTRGRHRSALGLGVPPGVAVQLPPGQGRRPLAAALRRGQRPDRGDHGLGAHQPGTPHHGLRSRAGLRHDPRDPDLPGGLTMLEITTEALVAAAQVMASEGDDDARSIGLVFLLAGPIFYWVIYMRYRNS